MELYREIIRSRQNRTVVETAKLTDRRAREASRSFRFDGIKLLEEALQKRLELEKILLRQSGYETLLEGICNRTKTDPAELLEKIYVLSDEVFDKISEEKSPEGVISVAKYIDKFQKNVTIYDESMFLQGNSERIVLLESVRDPLNIGAIIRSAAAIGVDRLILSADCADIYHPRAVRASMGTLFAQRIERTQDLTQAIETLQRMDRTVYAAALDAQAYRLGSFEPEDGACVVIGNEGHGLSDAVLAACSKTVYIPMSERAESFNAAVAASILMWELARPSGKC